MDNRTTAFEDRVVADNAAAFAGVSISIGIRLGLYDAMAGAGPLTSKRLAERAGMPERYTTEWLAVQVTSEYVLFDKEHETYLLPDEHAAVLADPQSPVNLTGGFTMLRALYGAEDSLVQAIRSGGGVGWTEYGPALAEGVDAFWRPRYTAHLVNEWIPALEGVARKLTAGAKVADVGFGLGSATLLMAEAYPASSFYAIDFDEQTVQRARRAAAERGLAGQVNFEVASAQYLSRGDYDLITFFDSLHEMGDPGAALRSAETSLAKDGTVMIVEPNMSADLTNDITPIGRSFAAISFAQCVPTAIAQNGPHALGNHAGDRALRQIAAEAGLGTWRVAAETSTARVLEVMR